MWRALLYIGVLSGLVAMAYFLPKVVQQTEGFQPLAQTVSADVAPTEPPAPPEPPPAPEVATNAAEPLPIEPEPPSAPDLTPFVEAMAVGDLPKAAALLDLLKSSLPDEKYKSLLSNVETARKREVASKEELKTDPAAIQAQAVMLETLRQLQQSQKETAQMLVQMRDQKPAAAEPILTSAEPSAMPTIKGELPGVIAVRFELDSSVMDQAEANKLQPALKMLKTNAATKVEIRGFADKSGSSTYNLGLSRSRATSVQDIFRRAGIADSRISLLPMGSFQAGVSPTPEEAAAMRKVEVLIVK
jgi:outer membrane protein OmpA-like peptidoglycan-associated protein